MIARIKKTGKLIDVVPYGDEFAQLFAEGDFKIYTKDELDFCVDVDWQQVRIQAAIAAMQAELSNPNNTFMMCEDKLAIIVRRSLAYADALVAELKGGQDD